MVFGLPGQVGLSVANYVVEELVQGQDLAMVKHVEEILALETMRKERLAINNVVVSISYMTALVERLRSRLRFQHV